MKRALITGGSGFIGKAITDFLSELDYQVYVFDHYKPNGSHLHLQGSILNFDEVCTAVLNMDVVYHLAGLLGTTELLSKSAEAVDVNVKGTVNVFEACRLAGVKRLFYPTKPNDWLNTYSITKRAGEEFARMYRDIYGMDIRILRWLNAYGPGQKLYPIRKAVPIMIVQALLGVPVEVYGDSRQPVDLIYVDDLARITVGYMELDSGDSITRDTGCTVRMTVNEMAHLIKKLASSRSSIKHLPMRLGEDSSKHVQLLDGLTAADLLGISDSTTDIVQGLAKTIEYYRQLPQEVVDSALKYFYGKKAVPVL